MFLEFVQSSWPAILLGVAIGAVSGSVIAYGYGYRRANRDAFADVIWPKR